MNALDAARADGVPLHSSDATRHESDPSGVADRPSPARLQATAPGERFAFLDVLRGAAILGVLPANIAQYGLPAATDNVYAVTPSGWREPLAYYVTHVFLIHNFITLFSLLFGVGIGLIYHRCVAAGRAFQPLFMRRMGGLALFGAAHVVLIWFGDILLHYALLGLLAMYAAGWTPRRQRWVGIALLCVPALFTLVATAVSFLIPAHLVPGDAAGGSTSVAEAVAAKELTVYGGGTLLQIVLLRLASWAGLTAQILVFFSWRILGLFLIGMSLSQAKWFLQPSAKGRALAVGVVGLLVGLPLQGASIWLRQTGHWKLTGESLELFAHYVGTLAVSAGYAGLAAWLYQWFAASWLSRMLASVGRMALTNYLLQSLLCSVFFYSYGFAMFGRVDRLGLWAVVAVIWVAVVGLSSAWMRRYRMGPVESLWRTMTYGRAPVMRVAATQASV